MLARQRLAASGSTTLTWLHATLQDAMSIQHARAFTKAQADGQPSPANIWCVGRNYAEHAKELGNSVPETPMIFLKAGSAVLQPGEPLRLPSWSQDVHHEIELALELGGDLQPKRAMAALDLTARDVQADLKKKQWPWTLAKSFPSSCPISRPFQLPNQPQAVLEFLQSLQLQLDVNGQPRQRGHTRDMVFSIPTLLQYLVDHFPVQPGDLVLTGTPQGVSAMREGDLILARILGPDGGLLTQCDWKVLR